MVKRKGNRKKALLRKTDTQDVGCLLQLACLCCPSISNGPLHAD